VIRRPEKEAILPTEFSPPNLHDWFSSENSTDSDKVEAEKFSPDKIFVVEAVTALRRSEREKE